MRKSNLEGYNFDLLVWLLPHIMIISLLYPQFCLSARVREVTEWQKENVAANQNPPRSKTTETKCFLKLTYAVNNDEIVIHYIEFVVTVSYSIYGLSCCWALWLVKWMLLLIPVTV